MELIICGGARPICVEKNHPEEIWALATRPVEYPDRLYGFHGEKNATHSWRNVPDAVSLMPLPLANSICVMLAHAICENRFSKITIYGSPLLIGKEYTKERPALAICVWYANNIAKIPTYWEGGIDFSARYMK